MPLMAKEKPKKKPNRSPAWVVYGRVDPILEPLIEKYINSPDREFKPTLGQVIEKAFKMLLKEDGLWPPPKPEADPD